MSQRDSKSLVHGAVDGLAFPVHVVIVVWFHCMYRPFLVIVINDLDVGVKRSFAPMIPDCSVLCTPAILKNIHNPLIFFYENGYLFMFWRVKSSKILSQASLHQISDLLTLVSDQFRIAYLAMIYQCLYQQ